MLEVPFLIDILELSISWSISKCASEAKLEILMEHLSRTFTGFAQLLDKLTIESAGDPGYLPIKKGAL